MTELHELTAKLKAPSRKTLEDVIRGVLIRAEELEDTTGTMFTAGDVRALAWAAQQYLTGTTITKEELSKAVRKEEVAGKKLVPEKRKPRRHTRRVV